MKMQWLKNNGFANGFHCKLKKSGNAVDNKKEFLANHPLQF
jgi:hypothetical protein